MLRLNDIVDFLDNYLDTKNVQDDSWNGLQVEGRQEVNKILFAVDAGIDTFKKALELNADMIVVHHGHFWMPANPRFVGFNKDRIEFLLKNNISLYASHLPLDKHPESGNNAQLLKILGFKKDKEFGFYGGQSISFTGISKESKTIEDLVTVLEKELSATCKMLPFGKKDINSIAVCSGGGTFATFTEALNSGVDLYLTGDSTEFYHLAKDAQFNVIFAGHHATETVGVKALSQIVKDRFNVETEFVDIPTGL